MLEVSVILTLVLRRFDFEFDPAYLTPSTCDIHDPPQRFDYSVGVHTGANYSYPPWSPYDCQESKGINVHQYYLLSICAYVVTCSLYNVVVSEDPSRLCAHDIFSKCQAIALTSAT
jgi:hypothetical protein